MHVFVQQATLASLSVWLSVVSVRSQVTSTYSVQVTTTTSSGSAGINIANYPQCAQDCGRVPICADPTDPQCICGTANRGNTSACQVVTCNDADYIKAAALAPDVCEPVYAATPTLVVAVSSAIASATSAARAAPATRNPEVLGDYPVCAQSCNRLIPPACANDRECLCRCPAEADLENPCLFSTCSKEELEVVTFLIYKLCEPVGGLFPKLPETCRGFNTTAAGPTAAPFPGNGTTPPASQYTGQGTVSGIGVAVVLLAAVMAALSFGL